MTDLIDSDAMTQMTAVAERLRSVRRAHERFLALWAVDHLLAETAGRITPDNPDLLDAPIHPLFEGRWPADEG